MVFSVCGKAALTSQPWFIPALPIVSAYSSAPLRISDGKIISNFILIISNKYRGLATFLVSYLVILYI